MSGLLGKINPKIWSFALLKMQGHRGEEGEKCASAAKAYPSDPAAMRGGSFGSCHRHRPHAPRPLTVPGLQGGPTRQRRGLLHFRRPRSDADPRWCRGSRASDRAGLGDRGYGDGMSHGCWPSAGFPLPCGRCSRTRTLCSLRGSPLSRNC